MLLVLLPVVWLAVVTVVVAACQAAASGDATATPQDVDASEVVFPGLVVWEHSAARMLRARYASSGFAGSARERTPSGARRTVRRRRVSHGIH
jgi:hypothetical protein